MVRLNCEVIKFYSQRPSFSSLVKLVECMHTNPETVSRISEFNYQEYGVHSHGSIFDGLLLSPIGTQLKKTLTDSQIMFLKKINIQSKEGIEHVQPITHVLVLSPEKRVIKNYYKILSLHIYNLTPKISFLSLSFREQFK